MTFFVLFWTIPPRYNTYEPACVEKTGLNDGDKKNPFGVFAYGERCSTTTQNACGDSCCAREKKKRVALRRVLLKSGFLKQNVRQHNSATRISFPGCEKNECFVPHKCREPLFAGRACNEFLQDVLAHFYPRYLHRPHPTPTPTLTLTLTPTPARPLTV